MPADPGSESSVTGDDDRRAEIEAVARAMWPNYTKFYPRDLQWAEKVIEALDRVRDARGDDETVRLRDELSAAIHAAERALESLDAMTERALDAEEHATRLEADLARVRDARGDEAVYSSGHAEAKARGEHRGHHGNPCWCVVDRILAARSPWEPASQGDDARGDDDVRAKLVEYATHKPRCSLRSSVERDLTPRGACTCGLTALLDRVDDARGDDEADRLANDLAGDWRERAERAEADVTMWKTRLVEETARLRELLRAARSPQDEDHETARPEQPPPDTLGGQPPAEPPEAP